MTEPKPLDIRFSKREIQVLEAMSYGHNTLEISELLQISKHTVETHRKNLLRKFNARNAVHLIRMGFHQGVLK